MMRTLLLCLFLLQAAPVPSPDGTTVPPAASLVDATGVTWTIGANHALLHDGVANGLGTQLLYLKRVVYTLGDDNAWWVWSGTAWSSYGPNRPGLVTPPATGLVYVPTELRFFHTDADFLATTSYQVKAYRCASVSTAGACVGQAVTPSGPVATLQRAGTDVRTLPLDTHGDNRSISMTTGPALVLMKALDPQLTYVLTLTAVSLAGTNNGESGPGNPFQLAPSCPAGIIAPVMNSWTKSVAVNGDIAVYVHIVAKNPITSVEMDLDGKPGTVLQGTDLRSIAGLWLKAPTTAAVVKLTLLFTDSTGCRYASQAVRTITVK